VLDMSGRIDDPVEASFGAWPKSGGLGKTLGEAALSVTGIGFPPVALAKIIYDHFQNVNRYNRIEYLLEAVRLGLKQLETQVGANGEKVKEMRAKMETPQFQEAVITACEEAAREINTQRIERLAAVLANSVTPSRWSPANEDVATLIRDLAQLGNRDIQVLGKLGLAFGGLMQNDPKFPSRLFTDNNESLDRIVRQESDPDEFYSTCGRLMGFGLAVDVEWPRNYTPAHERCIRPTRRGLALLEYLKP